MSTRVVGKYGRIDRDSRKDTLYLDDYVTGALPPAPGTVDRAANIAWPMYLNDELGDCTFATVGHEIQAFTNFASSLKTIPDSAVLSAYEAVGGYVPGDPSTDNGCEITDVLKYWQAKGVGGHKIAAWAELNVSDMVQLKQVLNTFGTVYLGLNVPQSAETQFSDNEPWALSKTGTNIVGGHAVPIQKWNASGVGVIEVVTWGALQRMTMAFFRRYVEEAYAVISQDWITANGTTIEGLALDELIADSKALSA